MDIDDILKNLTIDKGNPNGVYLREIALLMEENEYLKVEVEQLKKALGIRENKNSKKNK